MLGSVKATVALDEEELIECQRIIIDRDGYDLSIKTIDSAARD